MLDVIEKLLTLQNRDHKLLRLRTELSRIEPERQALKARASSTQAGLESARQKVKQIEADRKKLELEVDAKKQQIEKYSLQQFQTKKNEEYRALAHEIEMAREAITRLEDQQLDLMELGESVHKEAASAKANADESKRVVDDQISGLDEREQALKQELAELEGNREELASAVEDSARSRYERLLKHKGENVVVGIQHGVCGGCHMKLQRAVVVTCQAHQEIITCPNCGRILYYTPDMDLAAVD
jgi:predicted  nucleic acid-binding Zn-ribbon protein